MRLPARRGEVPTTVEPSESAGFVAQNRKCQHSAWVGLISTGPQPQGVRELSGNGLGQRELQLLTPKWQDILHHNEKKPAFAVKRKETRSL